MYLFDDIRNKEEGSALITVLIITMIISLFIVGILGALYVQVSFIQRDINEAKAQYKAEEGVFRLLDSVANRAVTRIDTVVYVQDSSRVQLSMNPFGGVYSVQSIVKSGNKDIALTVVVGEKASSVFDKALMIGDETSALNVTGSTNIKGDIITGKEGVQESSFKGFPFSGKIEGDSYEIGDDVEFPEFDTRLFQDFIENTNELFGKRNLPSIRVADRKSDLFNWSSTRDTVFFIKDLVIEQNEFFEVPANKTLLVDGNIMIDGELKVGAFSKVLSDDTLMVSGKLEGTDFIAYAETVLEVGGESEASGQFISSGRIYVSGNSYLQYPSVLYTSMEFFDGNEPEVIKISDQAVLNGTIIYPVENNIATRELFRVKVGKSATVRGGIYTLSQTELEGNILGTVATNQFYFYESPTTYINWLKDVSVDVTGRPENYIMPVGFSDTTQFGILNWQINREAP